MQISTDGKTVAATNPIKTITAAGIKGDAAKTAMSGFDWAGKKWVSVANGFPVPHAKCKIITIGGEDASCGKEGLSEGKMCSECGTVTVPQEKTPALTHDFSGAWNDNGDGGYSRACLNNCGETEYYAETKKQGVSAVTGIDAVPDGAIIDIVQIESGNSFEALGKTLGDTAKSYKLWDIVAVNAQGGVVQVDGAVTLTIDIPEGFSKNIKVYYFDGADSVEEIRIKDQTDKTVTIEAQHLSMYAIVDLAQKSNNEILPGGSEGDQGGAKPNPNEADLGIILNGGSTTSSPKTGESVAVVIIALVLLGAASFIFVRKLCR